MKPVDEDIEDLRVTVPFWHTPILDLLWDKVVKTLVLETRGQARSVYQALMAALETPEFLDAAREYVEISK